MITTIMMLILAPQLDVYSNAITYDSMASCVVAVDALNTKGEQIEGMELIPNPAGDLALVGNGTTIVFTCVELPVDFTPNNLEGL